MSNQIEGFIKGIILGGVIGAAIGILYAPQSGRKTREDINRKAEKLLTKGKEEWVLSSFLCEIFIGQFFEERQVLTHFSYGV